MVKKYLAPLGVFASGMILCLIAFLFLNPIGTEVDSMGAKTAAYAPYFWGWSWLSAGTTAKFGIMVALLLLTMWLTAKAFLKVRH